ncbi:hypothetical protein [Parageobacillus thermoglucosidasius]|uniref:Restriction endonuclease type IV Mrr domain-containing protein n=1 Tax=Parageobacillus thermoglucosidasius TaxID=1426 RepID=A0AB38R1C5_PARTM|nr:hypothetical protein [Parageobacillus thermoglucosidasius]UOE77160.1 hypothetical protein IMI45_04695 [Parageobacillus thermoglucosidasius]
MKEKGFINNIITVIEEATNDITKRLIDLNNEEGIEGREEELTSQFKSEISNHLIDEIRRRLNNKEVNGVKFKVYTYKKKDESDIGADLAGFLEISNGNQKITKAFLAQAKVCKIKKSKQGIQITGYDRRIINQAKKMLNITSDSFIFLYTNKGIYVTPAFGIVLNNSKKIDSKKLYYKSIGGFYKEFLKCFVGDHKLAELYNKPNDLKEIAKGVNANRVLYIQINVTPPVNNLD